MSRNHLKEVHLRMEPNDEFMTPKQLAIDLINKLELGARHTLLDPFKGQGAFFDNFPTENSKDWFEIAEGRDFFELDQSYDWMISNPPFSKVNEILEKSCKYSRIGFAYIFPTYSISYVRLKKIESFGFYLNKIVFFRNPKEWKIGYQMAFYVFTKKRSDDLKLIEESNSIQTFLF